MLRVYNNSDLNNLLVDYCQVHNIVKFNDKSQHLKVHTNIYKQKEKYISYANSLYRNNNNILIARHYIKIYTKDIHGEKEVLFRSSCYNGHLEIVKFLWSLDHNIDIHAYDEYAFRMSCYNGHLEVAKFLWSLNKGIDIHIENEDIFRSSCIRGHLEVVKFLWSLNQNINIHVSNEFAFRYSCLRGHFEVVKFLWSLNKKIDIHANNEDAESNEFTSAARIRVYEFAFRDSCCNGHLEIAKYLWSLNQNIDIHINNDKIFKTCCFQNKLEIVKFLITIYEQENNTKYLKILDKRPKMKSQLGL